MYRKFATTTAASKRFSSTRLRVRPKHHLTARNDAEHSRASCSCQNCSSMPTLKNYVFNHKSVAGNTAGHLLSLLLLIFLIMKKSHRMFPYFFFSCSPLGNNTNLETLILANLQASTYACGQEAGKKISIASVPQIKNAKASLSLIQAWFVQT